MLFHKNLNAAEYYVIILLLLHYYAPMRQCHLKFFIGMLTFKYAIFFLSLSHFFLITGIVNTYCTSYVYVYVYGVNVKIILKKFEKLEA